MIRMFCPLLTATKANSLLSGDQGSGRFDVVEIVDMAGFAAAGLPFRNDLTGSGISQEEVDGEEVFLGRKIT